MISFEEFNEKSFSKNLKGVEIEMSNNKDVGLYVY